MALCSQYCINFTVWRVVLLCATRFQFKNWNFVIILWLNIEYILMTIFSADEIFECDTLSKNMVEWYKNVTVFLSDVTIRSQLTYCCAYSATKNANGQNLEAKKGRIWDMCGHRHTLLKSDVTITVEMMFNGAIPKKNWWCVDSAFKMRANNKEVGHMTPNKLPHTSYQS